MLALALVCLGGLTIASQTIVTPPPPELPVMTLDGPAAVRQLSPAAQRPQTPSALPATRLEERLGAVLDGSRRVSLTFGGPLQIRDVLLLLFRGTPFSIVFEPGVSATFVGDLKDVTLRQAVEAVLFPAALDYDADGSVIQVFRRKPLTRTFSIDHLQTTRGGRDVYAEIGTGVQTMLSGTGKHHVNRQASLIQVTDFAERLDAVSAYLEAVHLRANRQVRIQTRIFEVSRAEPTPIEWSAVAANPRSGVRRSVGAAGWRVENMDAWLRTIGELGAVRHMAAPSVLAMNNEPVFVRADDASARHELRVSITPQIAADGIIHMHVVPSYADIAVATPAGTSAHQFAASFDTVMRLADGDTALMSGVLRRTDGGGYAELVVLLTVTTVTPAGPLAAGGR